MKMRYIGAVLFTVAVAGVAAYAQKKERPELKTVPSVDLSRYVGKWYEIARYPNEFQKDCVGNTTAEYVLKENQKIEVTNRCLTRSGEEKVAKGEAKIEDKSTNAKLKVRFAPAILSFIPSVWGDYWITEIGENYEYSVVGEPKREYFWILSRTPEMSDELYQQILRRAEEKGFDPGKVERTSQKIEAVRGAVIERN